MSKKDLIKIIIIVALFIFLVGLFFFKKDKDNSMLSKSELERQQLIESVKEKEKSNEITEEEREKNRIESMAKNFIMIYYSYTWGNFSNVESQYYYMTDEMISREKNSVKKMKKELENQPQRYFTASAKLINSNFIFYSGTKTTMEIDLNIDNIAGAMVQRDTIVWVDKNGNYYEGKTEDLIVDTINKKINISLIKINDEWKINKVRETKDL